MAKKRASLLNAFNTAVPKRPEPSRTPPVEPPRAAQPRFEARPDQPLPVRASSPVPMTPRPAPVHTPWVPPGPTFSRGRLLLLAIVGATIVLAVMLVLKFSGPSSDGEVAHAGVSGTATDASTPSANPAAKTPASGLDPAAGQTDDDKAFLDPRNKFTVRLLQYVNTPANVKLARETYRYLRTEGVLAVQPIQSGDGKSIYLCAGADRKREDLNVMCEFIKRMRGPDKKTLPFSDAYIENIERLINR
jgi:hypothetical protein